VTADTAHDVPSAGRASTDLRYVLDNLPGGVVVLDVQRHVRYFNTAASRMVHPQALRVGKPLPELSWEPGLHETVERLIQHRVVAELEITTPDDRTFVLDGRRRRKGPDLILLQLVDVTGRVRRRRAGEDFVVNAAHEFLSPLTAIAGSAHVLRDGGEADPEVRDRFLRHIMDATERLMGISRALLVLARAEAGMEPPRLDLVPIRPLLDEVAAATARELVVDCSNDAVALADPDLLRQALSNLVENARAHSEGSIGVRVEDGPGAKLRIEIADTGSGILPEHLERVTDRFFSGAGRDSIGFGIGLSIAARSLSAAGGTLTFKSDRGGTRAVVELPTGR